MLVKENNALVEKLRKVINVPVTPLTKENWINLFSNQGFSDIISQDAPMTLMSDKGMVIDEGEENAKKIQENAMKDKNKAQFLAMKKIIYNIR